MNQLSSLRDVEKKQEERIKSLEDELKSCKTKMTRTCKEMEVAKQIAEDALARVRVQAETAQKELELRKEELIKFKELATKTEADKEQGLKLLNQMQEQLVFMKKQLQQHQKETNTLKEMLQGTHKELDLIKTDRDALSRREQDLTVRKQELDGKISELEAQQQTQQISNAEFEKLKMEKELTATQLKIRMQELESLQQDLQAKEEEITRLRNEKDEVDGQVQADSLKLEELTKNLLEKNLAVERNLSEAVKEIRSLKAQNEAQNAEIEKFKANSSKTFAENSTIEEIGESDKSRLEKVSQFKGSNLKINYFS